MLSLNCLKHLLPLIFIIPLIKNQKVSYQQFDVLMKYKKNSVNYQKIKNISF